MTRLRHLRLFVCVVLFSLAFAVPSFAVSSGIVISQVYGGAGCGTANCSTYKNDYIELFNRGTSSVNVSGWSVQYASATGSSWQVTALSTATNPIIPPGGYLLVSEGAGANGINTIPTPDVSGSIAMSATVGKVALVNSTTALSGTCPGGAVDMIGYGSTASCFEGAYAPATSTTTADLRAGNGCTDTDSNSTDFSSGTPNPRNSSTTAAPCSTTISINDVSLNEGNAGTTSFTFTASLSGPAATGDVTFDIATADNTATQPGDYTQKSLTSQTIPLGNTTYSFTVLVNGDTSPETNETFFVNLTNVTGASVGDAQGQGTIVNDDAAPNLTINDVSLNEGNAGTTTYSFTVSLSAAAPGGGVTFDIATADNTATQPGDYTQKSLTGQTIPAGSSSYTFDVLVNGDGTAEPDETFLVNVTNVTNAIATDSQGQGSIVNDDLTYIHDVQGNGSTSPLSGTNVIVEGVVIGDYQGSGQLKGFFLQEEDADADADPATSEGIFVFCSSCPTAVTEGQLVQVKGAVSEFSGLTELSATTAGSVTVIDAGNHLADVIPTSITLPIAGDVDTFYETLESMLVTFTDTLSVSEYFELFRFGHIELYQGGRPFQFTETNAPDTTGYTSWQDDLARRRVILDDDNNGQQAPLLSADGSQAVFHPVANGGFGAGTQGVDFFRGGDQVAGLTGVLHWSYPGTGSNTWRIRPVAAHPVSFNVVNPRPVTPPAVGGAIRAVGMNMLNYFTTIDTTSSSSSGPCGPAFNQDCRGADSVAELNRQRERASVVICTLNPDVAGLMEMENTTASDTVTDLLGAVNARCGGAHPYAFVNTGGTLGTDAIRVFLIYRTGVLSPAGSPLVDLDPIHNRPPTAQTFDVVDTANPAYGERFTFIANHLKSKGGCGGATGGDIDSGDGQGCWAAERTAQANRLLTWVNGTVIPAAGDPDVLMVGDFNSYGQETPVTTITGGGFTDLAATFEGPDSYSYLFGGALGHLDYGFASSSMASQVTGVGNWHINADEVPLFDYSDEVKDVGESAFEEKPDGSALTPPRTVFEPATPYRASDHDPVLVGLFQIADVAITKSDTPDPVAAGTELTYTIDVTNNGPNDAVNASFSDTVPSGTTFVSLTQTGSWSCSTPAIGSGGDITCSAATFSPGSNSFTLTVQVDSQLAIGSVVTNTASVSSDTGDSDLLNDSATATTSVVSPALLSATKSVSGSFARGSDVVYTIVITNSGTSTQYDNPGNEFTDVLPPELHLVSAGASSGTALATLATNTVTWNGEIAAGSSVTVTITATIDAQASIGTTVTNQGTVSFDADGNGTNEASAPTDSPAGGGAADATVFVVNVPDIPALDPYALAALAALLAIVAAGLLRR